MSMIGKTLAHYEIISQLGKGGMGEVYQAKDRKLGRDVAIKVLPEEFAKDTDRVARFQREAKLLASLNHPNIAAIHGLEEYGGTQFLVLELVEGETLRDQLKRGPIPVEESLKLALQIAEALEAAHEKGVIHRDLKPSNINVTTDNKVKVLDFGLAKAFAGEQEQLNLSNSPTLSNAATQQGVILGTAAYMSPEQARGKAVDKRADIWAFGCVLFEMITGRVTFSGKDVTDILAAVIRAEPEWSSLPANLHWRLREVLERCLKKDAKDRYHDISDVKLDIQRVLTDPSGVLVQAVTTVKHRKRLGLSLPWVAAAVVSAAIIAGLAGWNLRKPEPRQVTRFSYEVPTDQQLFGDSNERALAISPDGRQFVYTTSAGLYSRSMDVLDSRLIPGTAGAQNPFFSPDGKWIGYWSAADSKLKKIAISGGAPVTLTDAGPTGSLSWEANDTILYGQSQKGIVRVPANGGTPILIAQADSGGYIIHPQMLPDGKSLLFTTYISSQPYKIMVQSLKSGVRRELFLGHAARYLPTGHIVYEVENNLFAIPFNLDRLETAGGAVPLVEGVLRLNAPQYAVSDSGTLVYVPGTTVSRTLVWVDRNGKEEPLSIPSNIYTEPRISPDGTKVALVIGTGQNRDVWIWDLVRMTLTRLTFGSDEDDAPVWSPDGKQIAFHTHQKDVVGGIYWKSADGTGEDKPVGSVPGLEIFPFSWSGDGRTLLMQSLSNDIGVLSTEGDHKHKPLLAEKYAEINPEVSPNGRWMAYTSNESGQYEIYVRPFPEVDKGRWQVSTSGGHSPLWSRDGRELFYRNGDAVIAVSVKTEPTFSLQTPKILFRGSYFPPGSTIGMIRSHIWDISPDGKRFLMMKLPGTAPGEGGPRRINIVLNWFEELKQRVPVK
jgi:serine/threonine protein kinase